MARIAVIGAGSWGTALSMVLADNGHSVSLWTHREDLANDINERQQNEQYLQGVKLPESIQATTSLETVLEDVHTCILAIPTKALREVLRQMIPALTKELCWVHALKGIEPGTYLRPSEIVRAEIPDHFRKDVAVLSGPSHAEEVCERKPTTVVIAAARMETSTFVQDLFMNDVFRVYTNADFVGVELGGALKNIIALGAGISDGLGYGDNAKAALITRGLAEISRLGSRLGGNPLTFSGLTGMGDLIATCTSVHSRNWKAGYLLGSGHSPEETLSQMKMVVEGVRTTEAVYQLASERDVDMPITRAIYDVWFKEKEAKVAVDELMSRDRRREMELFGEEPF
ncbi:NAD(P)H-dependent glycerol-3-phosphate dehydrogenase [Bacillaceae bacterium SIJ1]|uniref:NAD(P)H-dependent glycerol-3-phosphate dehydrogenase n=1 Tax=Litoribacterium kuwaitense TaxID=1398745 RepID=UPI0013EAB445|nr:NAD(P)H-dependent glycerol-3-phosphate dehydrogenase [Litoribacterium kuwaitense]NGP43697.1 NAD(P)H-dependent glycerol-3-phosphate dehydrogenase [Litoribacterium kuwaitense]